ncbi:hypothetical protein B0T20DRAFT_390490 [Sordaria brevicollis]|uniref:Uncharacterized protein n=1 Tax=Sordaria brevicollis TaxID=83679 RepID=A0AAE0UEA3_SORBR|nr:hypothetical protein B0T20DRAFT_390490 [Sordaria brevicollis]
MPPKRGRPSNAQKEADRGATVSKGKGVATTAAQEPATSPNGSITVSVGGPTAASPEMTKTASMKGGAASKKAKAQAEAAAKAKADAEEVPADVTMEEANASSTSNAAEATTNGESATPSASTTAKEGQPVEYGTIKKNSETALVASNGNSEVAAKTNNTVSAPRGGNAYMGASRVIGTGYENINNLEEIQLRQLHEDIDAYQHDLAYCTATLALPDLTPQETRTFQLRQLDLGHQIRHCQHRIENLQVQLRRQGIPFTNYSVGGGRAYTAALMSGTGQVAGQKRGNPSDEDDGSNEASGSAKKVKLTPDEPQLLDVEVDEAMAGSRDRETGSHPPNGHTSSPQRPEYGTPGTWEFNLPIIHRGSVHPDYQNGGNGHNGNGGGSSPYLVDEEGQQNTALQRLGYWKCRLCSAPKYLLAGTGRSPAAPCKWPLKDISKMITHFTEMHTEHTPAERCSELGYALAKNRGPFEYWLRRTRAQNVGDGEIIDEIISELINGVMPHTLRRLSRAAAGMPV